MKKSSTEYVAFKIKGLQHWIWFPRKNVKEEGGRLIGNGGWGKGGTFTDIDIDENEVVGTINSEGLQYS